jgi:hypothetical protein
MDVFTAIPQKYSHGRAVEGTHPGWLNVRFRLYLIWIGVIESVND